jgi:hypothetical protein
MIVAKTTGRFTGRRIAHGSDLVVSVVGLPVVRGVLLLPTALLLIIDGCGPPS